MQNNTQCGPKSTQLEESHFGGSKIQGMSIGDINKGTLGVMGTTQNKSGMKIFKLKVRLSMC